MRPFSTTDMVAESRPDGSPPSRADEAAGRLTRASVAFLFVSKFFRKVSTLIMNAKLIAHGPVPASSASQSIIPVPHGTTSLLVHATVLAGPAPATVSVGIDVAPALANGTAGTFVPSRQNFPSISAPANGFAEQETVLHFSTHPAALDSNVSFVRVTMTNASASAVAAASVHVENIGLS